MISVALLNMKGGVGKTTLAVNLAWQLARQDKRVLVVDLDPQFNASQYLMTYEVYAKHLKKGTVADILGGRRSSSMRGSKKKSKKHHLPEEIFTVEATQNGALHLIPSELGLARSVKNPQGVEFRLSKYLSPISKHFDYTFIDCAPTDTVLTATALMASDYVLVPIRPDRYSILGYGLMQRVLDDFRADYPDPKNVRDLGVVFTQVSNDGNTIEIQCKRAIADAASYVFKAEIPKSRTFLRAVHEGSPVFDTRYARQLTKSSMNALSRELKTRIRDLSLSSEGVSK